jgi:asparagine synthase (glutamine-hydrolysing)
MCRIAGIIEKHPQPESPSKLARMLASLAHGGPDDSGTFHENGVHLGHRRLSILDLSPLGKQPMLTPDGEVVISFNGEIFNFLSIREELEQKGYHFRSGSDTEVILHAWKEWGTSCFQRFNGMFALAIYDRAKNQVILARDHSGIKPLYYSLNSERLIFASEVRAFTQYDPVWEENPDWKVLFYAFGSIPFPFTTLQGVESLQKGSYLILDLDAFTTQQVRYHQFVFTDEIKDPVLAQQLIREELVKSVERHLISDAPIGVFLSGGIDSSLLALIADGLGTEKLKTISVTFKEATFDESPYQQMVLDRIDSDHIAYQVTEEMFIESLEDIFKAMDQPSIDGVNSYFVSKCAHQAGLKAVLSGLGADEYFGGYGSFQRIEVMGYLKQFPAKRALGFGLGLAKEEWKRVAWLDLGNATGDYLFLRGIFSPARIAALVNKPEKEVWQIIRKAKIEDPTRSGNGDYASYLESNVYMENQLLKDTDAMSMWHGLEVRVPFLDKDLLSLVSKVAPAIKYNEDSPKYLLTHTFCDLLPKDIVFRKKQGFTFPFHQWMRSDHFEMNEFMGYNSISKEVQQSFFEGKTHWSKYWALVLMNLYSINRVHFKP